MISWTDIRKWERGSADSSSHFIFLNPPWRFVVLIEVAHTFNVYLYRVLTWWRNFRMFEGSLYSMIHASYIRGIFHYLEKSISCWIVVSWMTVTPYFDREFQCHRSFIIFSDRMNERRTCLQVGLIVSRFTTRYDANTKCRLGQTMSTLIVAHFVHREDAKNILFLLLSEWFFRYGQLRHRIRVDLRATASWRPNILSRPCSSPNSGTCWISMSTWKSTCNYMTDRNNSCVTKTQHQQLSRLFLTVPFCTAEEGVSIEWLNEKWVRSCPSFEKFVRKYPIIWWFCITGHSKISPCP